MYRRGGSSPPSPLHNRRSRRRCKQEQPTSRCGQVSGADGDNKIAGGAGNDAEIIGDHRAANPSGASGDDDLLGDAGNDDLHGDSFADGIESGDGQDKCDGGPTTDTAANCKEEIGIP